MNRYNLVIGAIGIGLVMVVYIATMYKVVFG